MECQHSRVENGHASQGRPREPSLHETGTSARTDREAAVSARTGRRVVLADALILVLNGQHALAAGSQHPGLSTATATHTHLSGGQRHSDTRHPQEDFFEPPAALDLSGHSHGHRQSQWRPTPDPLAVSSREASAERPTRFRHSALVPPAVWKATEHCRSRL